MGNQKRQLLKLTSEDLEGMRISLIIVVCLRIVAGSILLDPKAARYNRYANMSFEIAMSFLPLLVVFYLVDIIDFKAFINPKELYLTPGLWDKTGISFWFSFLFETPFALMRGFAWSFMPLTIILYLLFGYRSNKLYLQNTSDRK